MNAGGDDFQRLLAAVLSSVSEGVVVADAEGNLVDWNDAALAMHGFADLAQVRRHLDSFPETFELRTPGGEVLPLEQWPMSRALRGETFSRLELWVRRLDTGLEKRVAYGGTPVRNPDGSVAMAVLTIRDLTERRRSEELLLHNRRQMEVVVQGANVGVWYCPLPFDRLIWDEKTKEHFHLPPDAEVTIDTFYERMHPDDRDRTRAAIGQSIERKEPYDIEYRTVSPDGSRTTWIRATGRGFYDAAGDPVRFDGITIDVTAQKRAEAALRDSERRFREMADTAPAMLWITEADGHCSFLSRGWYEFTGQTVEEGLGYGWANAAHPDDREMAAGAFRDATERRAEYAVDFRIRRADGQYRWVIDAGRPRFGPDGRFLGFIGSVIDITGRKEAESHLRAVTNTVPAIVWIGDPDGNVHSFNDRWYEYTGLTPAQSEGSGWIAALHPDDVDRCVAAWGEARARGGDYEIELRIGGRDRAYRWYLARAVPVRDTRGALTAWIGTSTDIHDRREAEQALRESEARFRHMADHAPVMIWVTRADGYCEYLNRPWYEFTGQDPQRALGSGWLDAVHPDDRAASGETFAAANARRVPFSLEYRLRRRDGKYRWCIDAAAPRFDAAGAFVGYVGSVADIHDRKAAEAERERLLDAERAARLQAEHAGRLKDDFLATLSHELRTPLNAILGWSQLLERGNARDDAQALAEGLSAIARNARAQTRLIDDLLDMSRIVSGKLRLNVQPLNPAGVVEAAIESVQPAAAAKGLKLDKVLDPFAGPVAGDPHRLQQAIWNLLTNAVKFTPRGGKIQVLVERVNSHIEITVSDTGQGIKPEFLPHMFERFRQADASTTRVHGGLGIGLALVKEIVALHGGEVRAKSPGEGRGATFVISMPLSLARQEEQRQGVNGAARGAEGNAEVDDGHHLAAATDGIDLAGLKVLVVDDDADSALVSRRILGDRGATVFIADSADTGLASLKRDRPDVLVSDIGMPLHDGYELIRRVRALPPDEGGRTPAVALTAFARSEDRRRALLAGFQSHVCKPVEPPELVTVIASLAGRTGG